MKKREQLNILISSEKKQILKDEAEKKDISLTAYIKEKLFSDSEIKLQVAQK